MIVALQGCWYFEDCPDNVGGIKDGQQLETTIVGPYAGSPGGGVESCGKLDDLSAGSTITWVSHLSGPAETCDDRVEMQPQRLSGARLAATSSSWTVPPTATLASGCEGTWQVAIHVFDENASLVGASNSESPSWVLERTFRASGDTTLCAGGSVPATCTDAFVAETAR